MSKTIICADALEWMKTAGSPGAVVTSLPDAEEIGLPLDAWRTWFISGAMLAMRRAAPAAPAIFYQTDRKAAGVTHSKAEMLFSAAREAGTRLLWHKIVLRRGPGKVDIHRPGFTHLIAFSVEGKPGTATPDVIECGNMLYPNAIGVSAAYAAVLFASSAARLVIDPFCGRGTVPAVAAALGLDAIGVDIDPTQCARAERLTLSVRS